MLVRIRPGLDFYKIETMEDYKQMPGIAEQSRAQQSWGEFCRPGHFYEPSCPHFVLKTWGKKKKDTHMSRAN